MQALCKLSLCAALALIVLPAAAQSLSLGEAQRRALERSRQLAAQDSAVARLARDGGRGRPAARPGR